MMAIYVSGCSSIFLNHFSFLQLLKLASQFMIRRDIGVIAKYLMPKGSNEDMFISLFMQLLIHVGWYYQWST
jgi:hypothetical protein